MKVLKFGGTSMADAGQYRKIRDIVLANPERKVIVVSAAGKRFKDDHKLTDLLYLCHAHTQYGVDCTPIFDMITSRYLQIRDELELNLDLESEFAALKARIDKKEVTREELVSRGEYYSAKLMAAYLGFRFVDATDWVKFNLDSTVNMEQTYAALKELGFTMPDSKTNFLFVKREGLDGGLLYQKLKDRGVLIRHFSDPRIAQYNRVTIGTPEEMAAFLEGVKEIMKEVVARIRHHSTLLYVLRFCRYMNRIQMDV